MRTHPLARLWCTITRENKATLDGHSQALTNIHFSPSNLFLATSSQDKTIRIWDIENLVGSIRTFTFTDVKVDKEDVKSDGKKRKSDSSIELALKKQLVDDWEFVNHQDKLVKLPRSPNVDDILAKYLEYWSKKDGMMADAVEEILKGLRCYFDHALSANLLYNKERKQFQELITDNISPSTVYDAEHLLRLFVKLPELLPYVNIEKDITMWLQQKFHDFLKVEGFCQGQNGPGVELMGPPSCDVTLVAIYNQYWCCNISSILFICIT